LIGKLSPGNKIYASVYVNGGGPETLQLTNMGITVQSPYFDSLNVCFRVRQTEWGFIFRIFSQDGIVDVLASPRWIPWNAERLTVTGVNLITGSDINPIGSTEILVGEILIRPADVYPEPKPAVCPILDFTSASTTCNMTGLFSASDDGTIFSVVVKQNHGYANGGNAVRFGRISKKPRLIDNIYQSTGIGANATRIVLIGEDFGIGSDVVAQLIICSNTASEIRISSTLCEYAGGPGIGVYATCYLPGVHQFHPFSLGCNVEARVKVNEAPSDYLQLGSIVPAPVYIIPTPRPLAINAENLAIEGQHFGSVQTTSVDCLQVRCVVTSVTSTRITFKIESRVSLTRRRKRDVISPVLSATVFSNGSPSSAFNLGSVVDRSSLLIASLSFFHLHFICIACILLHCDPPTTVLFPNQPRLSTKLLSLLLLLDHNGPSPSRAPASTSIRHRIIKCSIAWLHQQIRLRPHHPPQ
jgi:hypothetical protein